MADAIHYRPSGDCALTVEFGDRIDRDLSARVMALHLALAERGLPGVIETVPTFRSLLVHYDPLTVSQEALQEGLAELASVRPKPGSAPEVVKLPVCYGGGHGPDLAGVAAAKGISPDEVIRLHSAIRHYVYMIGFAPGHPYMGDLPEALTLPRRETPRTRIAAGTVAIAVGQTVIYPFESPGGWHAIGCTPVPLFDLKRSPPAVLRPGDIVISVPVSAEEYDDIAARAAEGRYTIEREVS